MNSNIMSFESFNNGKKDYNQKLKSLITVNTYKGSDKFYFKNPPNVGKINGYDIYVTFYYSHYDEYLVFSMAWRGNGKYDFHYFTEDDMKEKKHKFRTLNNGKFVPAEDEIDIKPNYLELIYNATQDPENIEFNKYFQKLYDDNRNIMHYFNSKRKEKNYNNFDPETWLKEFPKSLLVTEYSLMHNRYVNLKPNIREEEELEKHKSMSREECLKYMEEQKKISDMGSDIIDEILGKKKK